MLIYVYRLLDYKLVEEFLGMHFVGRVYANELWKSHLEHPVDVKIVEQNIENVGLRA